MTKMRHNRIKVKSGVLSPKKCAKVEILTPKKCKNNMEY